MTKRQHDDWEADIMVSSSKQIRIDPENDKICKGDTPNGNNSMAEIAREKSAKDGMEVKKGGRRRGSGTPRSGMFRGASVRDPLNLKNLKPIAPLSVERQPGTGDKVGDEQRRDTNSNRKWQRSRKDDTNAVKKAPNAKTRPDQQQKGHQATKEEDSGEAGTAAAPKVVEEATSSTEAAANAAQSEVRTQRRRAMSERFRYGNFNQYQLKRGAANFGKPSPQLFDQFLQNDPRVDIFSPDWFVDKCVLDIGSNAGRFAISLARHFQPKRVVGIDLDQHLVGAARKNIRHFADKDEKLISKFPASFGANFGPISGPSTSSSSIARFPLNIWFFCDNYVLPTDADLAQVIEEYDIIFALSIIKWVHLNWGDAGVSRFFQRVFRQLRTGGRFVLETSPFKEYKKHCNKKGADRPPEEVLNSFEQIRLTPDKFTDFLLNTVGFSHHEELSTPQTYLGISGRLQVFYKGKFMLTEEGKGGGESEQCP